MTPEQATRRLVKSRHTMALYERNGLPGGPVQDSLKMLADEVSVLEGIALDHTNKAATIAGLINRYRELMGKLRVKLN